MAETGKDWLDQMGSDSDIIWDSNTENDDIDWGDPGAEIDWDTPVEEPAETKGKKPKGKKKSKQKVPKEKTPKEEDNFDETSKTKLKKLTAGRIVAAVLVGLIVSGIIFLISASWYKKYVRYPAMQEIEYKDTGRYAIDGFKTAARGLESTVNGSYLVNEIKYANNNADRIAFMKRVASTIDYKYGSSVAKNIFGNDMINSEDDSVVYVEQNADPGETVTFVYVDYDAIEFDRSVIEAMLEVNGLTSSDLLYQDKLTDMFCEYIYSVETLPTVKVERAPYLTENPDYVVHTEENKSQWNAKYVMTLEEDKYIDELLFSSDPLYNCFDRFAILVWDCLGNGELGVSNDWMSWNNLSEAKKADTPEPLKYGKYGIPHTWCGSYYLGNEYRPSQGSVGITPRVGDGTFEEPAGLNTPVLTYHLEYDGDELLKLPITVELVEYGASQDALNYFQSRDTQNRGYDVNSEVQYFYAVFKITNLGDRTITIVDDSALTDKNANIGNRTGTIYGLIDTVTLVSGETGYVETWGRSTELNLKYLIWGKSFERRLDPVWFRVLAGNIDDPSEDKGVYINHSRDSN